MMIKISNSEPVGEPVGPANYRVLSREARITLISRHLQDMGHALAGDVDPVLVAELMLLADRLHRKLDHDLA